MCIHVITVTSEGPLNWTPGPSRPHTIHTMYISQYNTGMEQIKKKSSCTVKRVPLTKNRWRAPFVAHNEMTPGFKPFTVWQSSVHNLQSRAYNQQSNAYNVTRVVRTTDAVTSAYNWRSNWHKFSKMFTTDTVVCRTDTNVHTTVPVNVYNWQNSAHNWQSNNYTNRRRIHLQPTG